MLLVVDDPGGGGWLCVSPPELSTPLLVRFIANSTEIIKNRILVLID
jgi:hypothetical protein